MNDFDDIPFASSNESNISSDSSFDEIPFSEEVVPQVTNNNILFLDDRIKDIPARNAKVSFKKTSIILPVIAFVFVSILGMYLFVNHSKADTANLIRIEENRKFGYIDNEGTIVARPKYISGTEFYKGYAIVRNTNNLYGVINGKGVIEVPFGNYYYIGLFGNRYVASRITNSGLKQALLDTDLDELTGFKYDSISYSKNGMYLFTRDETMGILNKEGKEIYSFKVDEVDDKNIDIEISEVDMDLPLSERYAKVKVNDSSTIINLSTGKEIYSYTLNDINVLNNNVFYIKTDNPDENSIYIVINDNQIKLKTTNYKRVRVDDYNSDMAIAVNDDSSISYVNLLTQKVLNENKNNDYYYGNGLLLEKSHDFNRNEDVYNIISAKKTLGTFKDYKPVNNIFYNDILNVELHKNKYNFIDKEGNLLNSNAYDETTDFNDFGYAIVVLDKSYGIIDKKGKEVVKMSYNYIDFLKNDLFKKIKDTYNKELFIYANNDGYYGFINNKNKIEIESKYQDLNFISDEYPFVIAKSQDKKVLVNLSTGKELKVKLDSDDIEIRNDYFVIDNNYYNYSGKLIYKVK